MAFIDWSDNYSVGIEIIDGQHIQLVEKINQLHEAMRTGRGKEASGPIIDSLIKYAATHFKTEEELFDRFGYPKATAHKMEHLKFVEEVMSFKNDFEEGKLFLSISIMDFLKDWLIRHILASDKDYSPFLNSKGIK